MPDPSELDALRREIDEIDRQLVHMLGERARLAVRIGRVKQAHSLDNVDMAREQVVLDTVGSMNRGPLSHSQLRTIFTEIIGACRQIQEPTRVAYLGPEGTFTHSAASQRFGRDALLVSAQSIIEVFRLVEGGAADFGLVPVENSIEGPVSVTLDRLATSHLSIVGEVYERIAHDLMSQAPCLHDVRMVVSHPQALAQCRSWLSRNLPGIPTRETSSTASAAQEALGQEGAAVIGHAALADQYGLTTLCRAIQDRPLNLTRFLVLGGATPARTGHDKTSVLFVTSHTPGALCTALAAFGEQGINLTRIESRPAKDTPWEYVFFADLVGHREDEPVRSALNRLASSARHCKLLGSYPMGMQPDQGKPRCGDIREEPCTRLGEVNGVNLTQRPAVATK